MPSSDYMPDESHTSQNLSPAEGPLTERQQTAIALLVMGMRHTAVASELGVNRRTVWQWKQDPAFLAALNAELEQIRAEATVRMHTLVNKAFETLEHVLDHGYTDNERLAAARLVFRAIGLDH